MQLPKQLQLLLLHSLMAALVRQEADQLHLMKLELEDGLQFFFL